MLVPFFVSLFFSLVPGFFSESRAIPDLAQTSSLRVHGRPGRRDAWPIVNPGPYNVNTYDPDFSSHFEALQSFIFPPSGMNLTVPFHPGARDTATDVYR